MRSNGGAKFPYMIQGEFHQTWMFLHFNTKTQAKAYKNNQQP